MHYNATKFWFNVLEKLVREQTHLYEINKALAYEIIPEFDGCCLCKCFCTMDVKLSLGQQKIYNPRRLYLISLGEEMVKPDIRKRIDSGNFERHPRRAMRVTVFPWKQTTSLTSAKKGRGRRHGRCFVCPAAKDRSTDWKCCHCSEWVCKDHIVKSIQMKCENRQEQ